MASSVDPDEEAHYEPPHLALHCLQISFGALSASHCKIKYY